MGSFIRKYSALTRIPKDQIQNLFIFRPVIIGAELHFNGARFKFFYSFHTIPCIGFEVYFQDKSIYFSGDTFYDPEKYELNTLKRNFNIVHSMKEIVKKGIMSPQRMENLTKNKFNHTIILHEAGVPPIHTPIAVLESLSEDVDLLFIIIIKKNLRLKNDCILCMLQKKTSLKDQD